VQKCLVVFDPSIIKIGQNKHHLFFHLLLKTFCTYDRIVLFLIQCYPKWVCWKSQGTSDKTSTAWIIVEIVSFYIRKFEVCKEASSFQLLWYIIKCPSVPIPLISTLKMLYQYTFSANLAIQPLSNVSFPHYQSYIHLKSQ